MRRVISMLKWVGAGMFALALVLAVAVYGWRYPIERLSPGDAGPLVVTDRQGNLLRKLPGPDGRREDWKPLAEMPAIAVLEVVASEDERFFQHRGVDARGFARAAWLNLKEGRIGYGGSTITMQLVRMVHSAGQRRTLWNKVKESILALRLERAFSKQQILEQYLNRAYFNHGAYGLEAAARTYFNKPAAALSPGEATLLAIIPRGPGLYDPLQHLDRALKRRDHVLGLLVSKDLLDRDQAERARREPVQPALHVPVQRAPHFVDWVVTQLPEEIKRTGGVVRTTLSTHLQAGLELRVADHVSSLEERDIGDSGAVVLDTATGEVLAMVGSPGFFAEGGQVNITVRPRHPGSALKPFVYALALEQGQTPASIALDIADVPSTYHAQHLSQPERGPVRFREALAGSYNLAAVHVLEAVGVEQLLSRLKRAGLGGLAGSPDDYGLSLALGSARVRLVELAAAYGFLARDGRVARPRAVIEVRRPGGEAWRPELRPDIELFSPEVSWLVMDMLSDPQARRPAFGMELPLDLPFAVAAKTGTSRGFADTVAVAVTSEVIVAAWTGNFDGSGTQGLLAMRSAAPLVRAGLLWVAADRRLTLPPRPTALVAADVCPLSGLRPSPDCPHRKREHFIAGTEPNRMCDWHEHPGRVRWPKEVTAWATKIGAKKPAPAP